MYARLHLRARWRRLFVKPVLPCSGCRPSLRVRTNNVQASKKRFILPTCQNHGPLETTFQSSFPAEVRSEIFSIFLCQKCREICREILVTFSTCYVLQGLGVRPLKYHRTSCQKRCEKRKCSRKFHSAGAWR